MSPTTYLLKIKFHLFNWRFSFLFPVPVVTIEGSPDIHAQAGSSVTLKCSISEALQRPKSVKWQVPILSFMRVFLDLPE